MKHIRAWLSGCFAIVLITLIVSAVILSLPVWGPWMFGRLVIATTWPQSQPGTPLPEPESNPDPDPDPDLRPFPRLHRTAG